jgi:hypothetical protein
MASTSLSPPSAVALRINVPMKSFHAQHLLAVLGKAQTNGASATTNVQQRGFLSGLAQIDGRLVQNFSTLCVHLEKGVGTDLERVAQNLVGYVGLAVNVLQRICHLAGHAVE